MIARLIDWCIHNRIMVLILAAFLVVGGIWAMDTIKLDAIPDLSDVQVILYTNYEGQAPQIVEDQVTYPLTKAMLAVPGSKAVRGLSMFGTSFVYIIFEDGTDLYWARSRVLERLNYIAGQLPPGAVPQLGPDATAVGWVYQYVLVTGKYCPDHPDGAWQDPATGKWYADPSQAPADKAPQARLIHHRIFEDSRVVYWDAKDRRQYQLPTDAPADARSRLQKITLSQGMDRCPLDGKKLLDSRQDLAALRSQQDWYLRYELTAVPGVSEVAPIGGFQKQYQVTVDPVKLLAFNIPLSDIRMALERSNQNAGGRVVEMSEREYAVQGLGYLGILSQDEISRGRAQGSSLDELRTAKVLHDLQRTAVGVSKDGTPIYLADVAHVQVGPEMRRGLMDWNGRGEAVGGIVVMRSGENARTTIQAVRTRLAELEKGLPPGVAIQTGYDRSDLIDRAVGTLTHTLLEEITVVALVCIFFLLHARSELVAVIVVPLGVLCSLLLMRVLGINANIMSLGGIAIAIGVMVDSSIVMVENSHKHLDREEERLRGTGILPVSTMAVPAMSLPFGHGRDARDTHGQDAHATHGQDARVTPRDRREIIAEAAKEVGPSLFFALLIIVVSFLPIFVLTGEAGRMFKPLAFTKTFAMASSALLAVTVIPVLMSMLITSHVLPKRWGWPTNLLLTLGAMFLPAIMIYNLPLENLHEYRPWIALGWVVLMGMLLVPQKIIHENVNPISWLQQRIYQPFFVLALRFRWFWITMAILALLVATVPLVGARAILGNQAVHYWPWLAQKFPGLGSEDKPTMEEGDLLYMPTTDPGLSMTKAREIVQQTDRLIAQFPEVASIEGKAGRADTATDPAPVNMFETTITLHRDKSRWRQVPNDAWYVSWPPLRYTAGLGLACAGGALVLIAGVAAWERRRWWGWLIGGAAVIAIGAVVVHYVPDRVTPLTRPITQNELIRGYDLPGTSDPKTGQPLRVPGMDDALRIPGLYNSWTMPIETRLNMLSTGIKTPVGIKIMGPDPATLNELAQKIAHVVQTHEETGKFTLSVFAEQTLGGSYLDIGIDREEIARYGLAVQDVQDVISSAMGGLGATTTVEGLQRYSVNLRYPPELRDSLPALKQTLVTTRAGVQVPLGQLVHFDIRSGPDMIRSENARRSAWVYVDMAGTDLVSYVENAQKAVSKAVPLPEGYTIGWSGKYENWIASRDSLLRAIALALVLIVLLLYVSTRSWLRVAIVMLAVPFSLIGAVWAVYWAEYNISMAVIVGVIALAGLDAETGVVMLLYLDNSFERFKREGRMRDHNDLWHAVHDGAVKRIRPKTMTVATAFIGLVPLLWATGAGADTMRHLAVPMIGGLVTSFIMELLIYPVIFYIAKGATLGKTKSVAVQTHRGG
jgi:Cu(I)/Ag(I) efflux system membrane protein CusA/SilA